MTLLELAERCEAASGPDIDLERDIVSAIAGRRASGPLVMEQRYTASIDAARTLVPEGIGWWFSAGQTRDGNESFAYVIDITGKLHFRAGDPHGKVANPALALCAAALRARAHLASRNDAA
jgi:hypothetical protein